MPITETARVLAGIDERDRDHARLTGDRWGRRPHDLTTQKGRRLAKAEALARAVWVAGVGFVDPEPA